MKLAIGSLSLLALLAASLASAAGTASFREEHVTGGAFDLVWDPGYGISTNAQPVTLDSSNPAYANPSGDHTVLNAATSIRDSGNICVSATDPAGADNYTWEAWVFTGDGTATRGIIVRADPTNAFSNNYQFVLRPGLFELRFRRADNQVPTTLASFFASSLPAGSIPVNTWHKLTVMATGPEFRCFVDDFELTSAPIMDATYASGWVGVYNFKFDAADLPGYFDDLVLSDFVVPVAHTSWGALKALYR